MIRFATSCALLSALGALALHPAPVRAAEVVADTAPIDRRIDLDLVDARARQTFETFASVLDAKLELGGELAEKKVTIRLQNVRTATALDAVCDSLGCRWRLTAGRGDLDRSPRLVVTATPVGGEARPALPAALAEPLSLDLVDAQTGTVLETFARILRAELVLPPDLAGGETTLHLTSVPLSQALDTVLGGAWTWRVDDDSAQRKLIIRRSETREH